MSTIDEIKRKSIISRYADVKRDALYDNSLLNDEIKNIIIAYIDETENLLKRNFITFDEAIIRIAMSEGNALKEAQA